MAKPFICRERAVSEITPVNLPAMGEGIHEAQVNCWLKQEGDIVKENEPLLEVSTDKVDTEITAPCSGVLQRIVVAPEQTVAVGALLAEIGAAGTGEQPKTEQVQAASQRQGIVSDTTPPTPKAATSDTSAYTPQPNRPRLLTSPLVRRRAAEQGIDLTQVRGSGLHGRITVRDLKSYQHASTPSIAPPAHQEPHSDALHPVYRQNGQEYQDGVAVRREPMSRMRRLIAEHMSESVRISPHVTTVFEVDVERIGAARQRQAEEFQRQTGFSLTWTAFFVHIAVLCLKKFPLLNVSLDGNDILWKDDINIGCAVALENGLIVPVIKKAGELSLLETAHKLQELVAKARAKQLAADDVRGGTFTLTNPGIYGSFTSNPIINQPQVAILGLGRIAPTVVAIDGMVAVRQMMLVSLTFDHRIVDGEMGAKFLAAYRDIAQEFD